MASSVYFVQAADDPMGLVKIGFTEGPPSERLKALQAGCPVRLRVLASIPGRQKVEAILHVRFAEYREFGEWFRPHESLLDLIRLAISDRDSAAQTVIWGSSGLDAKRQLMAMRREKQLKAWAVRKTMGIYGFQLTMAEWSERTGFSLEDLKEYHDMLMTEGNISRQEILDSVEDIARAELAAKQQSASA